MPRNLLVTLLVAELAACWSSAAPARDEPPGAWRPPQRQSSDDGVCRETGDRLVLVVCRRGHDLEWTVTNATDTTLWVFVAPPSITTGSHKRENAFVRAANGVVTLSKIQITEQVPEPILAGAIALAPSASDSGVVPLGPRLSPDAPNFWGRPRAQPQRIRSVVLEVAFADRRPTDRPHPPTATREFFFVLGIERARQELVRSAELSWL
jgi:hypothetical protein